MGNPGRRTINFRVSLAVTLSLLSLPAALQARNLTIDVPQGTVAEVAFGLGKQAGLSIAIKDRSVSGRRAMSIRGRMSSAAAVSLLARSAGLEARAVGPRSFILVRAAAVQPKGVRPGTKRPVLIKSAVVQPAAELPAPDIIVTASKRETPSRRYAGQYSRIDGKDLNGWGVVGSEAIEARTVGFSSTHLGAGRNKLFIRGIADSSFSGPTQSPVGQYVGDLRTGYSGPDPDLRLVDIASVEVLEGPQGTLYGSGSLGGIVRLNPRSPDPTKVEGQAGTGLSATQHGDFGSDFSGVVNLPIGRGAAIRAVAYRVDEGGYIDNLATGEDDANRVKTRGGRLALVAPLAAGWTIELGALGQSIRGDDSQYADDGLPPLSRDSEVDQRFSSDFGLASFVVRKSTGAVRMSSTTGATFQHVIENFDASNVSSARRLSQDSRARAISNETRLWRPMRSGYSWLFGFSSIVSRHEVSRTLASNGSQIDLAGVVNRVRESTFFGEAGVQILPGVEASAGGRYTIASLSGWGHHLDPVWSMRGGGDASRSEQRFLPSASILFQPKERFSAFVRYQKGFRPGGLSLDTNAVRKYRNDRIETFDLGFRYRPLTGNGVDLQGGISHSDWDEIQADFIDANGLPTTANIGNGRVWTATLNLGFQIANIHAEVGATWNDGKVTQVAEPFLIAGREERAMHIPNIARAVARAKLDWSHDIDSGLTVSASLYARYVGRSRLGIGPRLGESQGDYVDSGLSMNLRKRSRIVSLSVTNLSDEIGNRFALGTPVAIGHDQITPLKPRSIRLGFEQKF